ncbi:MAG: tetratricopeptide repeat protein [Chloroflexi bacterium]|nr:tetratricopeptide repeat protein [Chloroflexota bacterium]
MSTNQFRKTEEEYFRLKGQLATGRLTQQQFDAALKALMVQDAQGHYWMLGADSGKWYMYDGKNWIEATPPGGMSSPPAAFSQTPQRAANNFPIVAIGGGVLVLLLLVAIFFFATSQGIIKIGVANVTTPQAPSPIVVVIATTQATSAPSIVATRAVIPTATITPTLTISDTLAQADAFTLQSKYAEAIAIYQRVLDADSKNILALARLARTLDFQATLERRSELFLLAVSKAEAASQLAPTNGEVATRLARAYDWNSQFDLALKAGQSAIQLAPNSGEAFAFYAEALLDNNKVAEGEAAIQKALQLDPNNADAHRINGLDLFLFKRQQPDAIAEFEKAAQLEPNSALRQYELGVFYRNAKSFEKSIAAFQRALQLYPPNIAAYIGLSAVYLDQKQYDSAVDVLNRALQLNDKSADLYYRLGQAYYAAEKCAQAIPAFQKTIELNSKANFALTFLGFCQLKAGNTSAAQDAAQKAAAIDPNNADTKNLLAQINAALTPPTPSIPPGLYVTGIRPEPNPPKRNQPTGFYANFLNTLTTTQNYRWLIVIFRVSNLKNSFGETSPFLAEIPVGAKEFKTISDWNSGIGGCEDFMFRVALKDQNNQNVAFVKPDGTPAEFYFTICP